jgi:hypothetical protein
MGKTKSNINDFHGDISNLVNTRNDPEHENTFDFNKINYEQTESKKEDTFTGPEYDLLKFSIDDFIKEDKIPVNSEDTVEKTL